MADNCCLACQILEWNYQDNNHNGCLHTHQWFFHMVVVVVVVVAVAEAEVVVEVVVEVEAVVVAVVEDMGKLDVVLGVLAVEAEVDNQVLDYRLDNLFRKNLF